VITAFADPQISLLPDVGLLTPAPDLRKLVELLVKQPIQISFFQTKSGPKAVILITCGNQDRDAER